MRRSVPWKPWDSVVDTESQSGRQGDALGWLNIIFNSCLGRSKHFSFKEAGVMLSN
jgi:hypothetical protein